MKFLLFSLLTTVQSSITDCSLGSSIFTINGLGFWPDPATINENSTISFDFTVPYTVDSGSVLYSYTLNGLPLGSSTEDLCTQTKCPIYPGTYNQSSSSDFPDVSGKIKIKIEWQDTDSKILLCSEINTRS